MSVTKPVGIYLSVPFCKAKCSFCNFASDAFAPARMDGYVDRLCHEIRGVREAAESMRAALSTAADSVYFGGGTPSLLQPQHFQKIFGALRDTLTIAANAEVTIECAPGQMADATLAELLRQGVNRVSLGVQSFVDREAAAVGRLHTGESCECEIVRLRTAGIGNIGVDLIAGLPHQNEASWCESVRRTVASGVTHVSVYMLEVDEDSRLGREAIGGGSRYGAAVLPSEDESASLYEMGCAMLNEAGVKQYEISNFARAGYESRHNVKYWRRDAYVGFGLDAHSMLHRAEDSVRFRNTDDLDEYIAQGGPLALLPRETREVESIDREAAFEESLFLGLRMNAGVDLSALSKRFGDGLVTSIAAAVDEAQEAGLLEQCGSRLRLTARGRMASNEVFSRLLIPAVA